MTRPPREMSIPEQRRRTAELDELRVRRGLTLAEAAEADNLAHRHYLRERRALLAARGLARRAPVNRPHSLGA